MNAENTKIRRLTLTDGTKGITIDISSRMFPSRVFMKSLILSKASKYNIDPAVLEVRVHDVSGERHIEEECLLSGILKSAR